VITSTTYGYDDNDRLTTRDTTGTGGAGQNAYGYDQAGRLTTWKNDGRTTRSEWEEAGSRVGSDGDTATYDERNRRAADADATYAYTPRGTIARKSSTSGPTSTRSTPSTA
jgi:YD repeat-containing protein